MTILEHFAVFCIRNLHLVNDNLCLNAIDFCRNPDGNVNHITLSVECNDTGMLYTIRFDNIEILNIDWYHLLNRKCRK